MPLPDRQKYTSDEFFRIIPESNSERYELCDGEIVYLASPSTYHQILVGRLFSKIDNYITSNNGKCKVIPAPYDIRLDDENVVIPDISVICDPSKIDDKRCNGAPDFVIEIVSGNWKDDYVRKLGLYHDCGVREYWIIDPKNQKTLVYFFDKSDFPDIYTFDTPIPVGIYADNSVKLEINIAELIK